MNHENRRAKKYLEEWTERRRRKQSQKAQRPNQIKNKVLRGEMQVEDTQISQADYEIAASS
jgi:hypothetical protein